MSKGSKKFNFTKWSFILGTPIALIAAIAATVTIPEVGCRVGLKLAACVVPLQEVALVTQAETGESLVGVKIQFIAQGAPEVQYTDSNGYAKVRIPSVGDVRVNLSKSGYPIQDFVMNLRTDQSTERIIRFSRSGVPVVEPVASLPPSTPSPSPVSIPEPPPSSPAAPGSSPVLTQTQCQSATPGKTLDDVLGGIDNFPLTLGREVVPLLVVMGNNGAIYRSEPVEIVCNLQSSYTELQLVYGVHSGNSYSLSKNKLLFSVFLDSKPAGTKEIVVGSKQKWNLNLQSVTNVALRAECTTAICPALSFTEMTLK